jgi:hypothetical protein
MTRSVVLVGRDNGPAMTHLFRAAEPSEFGRIVPNFNPLEEVS